MQRQSLSQKEFLPTRHTFDFRPTKSTSMANQYATSEYFSKHQLLLRGELQNEYKATRNALLTAINMTDGTVIGKRLPTESVRIFREDLICKLIVHVECTSNYTINSIQQVSYDNDSFALVTGNSSKASLYKLSSKNGKPKICKEKITLFAECIDIRFIFVLIGPSSLFSSI